MKLGKPFELVEGKINIYLLGKTSKGIAFAFASPLKKGDRKLSFGDSVVSCRDYLHEYMYSFLDSRRRRGTNTNANIGTKRSRLFVIATEANENFEEKMLCATKVIDYYGSIGRFKKSNLHPVILPEKYKGKVILWSGDIKWFSYPQLLSFVSFIFRVVNVAGPFNFSNEDDLQKEFERTRKLLSNQSLVSDSKTGASYYYSGYIRRCAPLFNSIFNNISNLFPRSTMYDSFKPKGGYFHSDYGIQALCSNLSGDKEMRKRMYKFCIDKPKN